MSEPVIAKVPIQKVINKVIGIEYSEVVENEQERGRALYSAGLTKAAEQIMLSLSGGDCTECGKPWEKVETKNNFAAFTYYRPTCTGCFPICSTVHTSWIAKGVPGHFNSGCGAVLAEEWYVGAITETRMMKGTKQYRNILKCNKCGNIVALQAWTAVTNQKKGDTDDT